MSEDSALSGNNWLTYCSNDPVNRADANGKVDIDLMALFRRALDLLSNSKFGADEIIGQLLNEANKLEYRATLARKRGNMFIAKGEELILKALGLADEASRNTQKQAGEKLIELGGRSVAESVVLLVDARELRIMAEILRDFTDPARLN